MAPPAEILDTVVVGAGPAGIGTALALSAVEGLRFGIMERGRIGQTFLDWPAQQSFLTPSFTGNGFGATDLNAVHPKTSPAYSLGADYLSGPQYATYLRGVAGVFHLPIASETPVTEVRRVDEGFEILSPRGPVLSRTLVWAGGEFHQPLAPRIPGAQLAEHSSSPSAWEPREGETVVIGGNESGVDLACHHVAQGGRVVLLDKEQPWEPGTGSDPSFRLAPRSRLRLAEALRSGRLDLVDAHATRVGRDGVGYTVGTSSGRRLTTPSRPVSAVGFGPGLGPVEQLFEKRPDGWPLLDEDDQSTLAPGLFLSGPSVRHEGLRFCFIYKFRQRFAHVAGVIGARLGKDCGALEAWRAAGMLTDDLSCCAVECAC